MGNQGYSKDLTLKHKKIKHIFQVGQASPVFGRWGSREKTNKAQTIKGNQAWRKPRLSGSLVTYQCGEAVGSFTKINNGKKDMAGRRLLGDTDKRLRAFRRGGGKYLENEMPE